MPTCAHSDDDDPYTPDRPWAGSLVGPSNGIQLTHNADHKGRLVWCGHWGVYNSTEVWYSDDNGVTYTLSASNFFKMFFFKKTIQKNPHFFSFSVHSRTLNSNGVRRPPPMARGRRIQSVSSLEAAPEYFVTCDGRID